MTEQIIFILILRVAEPFIPQDNDSLKISVCLQLCLSEYGYICKSQQIIIISSYLNQTTF